MDDIVEDFQKEILDFTPYDNSNSSSLPFGPAISRTSRGFAFQS